MHFESSIQIAAPAEQVWAVYYDVVRWPEWTASMTSVELLDSGPLRVGSRVRIRQPRLPVAEWTVTGLDQGHRFTWVSEAPGIRTTGHHVVTATGAASCEATGAIDQQGPLGWLFGTAYRRLINRYLDLETTSLKRLTEVADRAA